MIYISHMTFISHVIYISQDARTYLRTYVQLIL